MFKKSAQSPISQSHQATNLSGESSVGGIFLTEEETKKILTPFAFKIDESLFGIPLAVPWRRGIALFTDFILISLYSYPFSIHYHKLFHRGLQLYKLAFM